MVGVRYKTPTGDTRHYTYADHLGNVALLSWLDGTVVPASHARYDPFGNYRTLPATSVNPGLTSRGFTGHQHNNTGDYDLGLIYMNARYYLPEVGRFASADTIVPEPKSPQSYNRYSYTLNNPIRYTDPTGHMHLAGEQFSGRPTQGHQDAVASGTDSALINSSGSIESVIVTTPRVTDTFPLPESGNDLTQWLVELLIAYASSAQVHSMALEWQAGKLIFLMNPAIGEYMMADVLQEWVRHVYRGAVWDFKPDLNPVYPAGIQLGKVTDLSIQAVANIFYGFIGQQVGMSESLLQAGAGIAQGFDKKNGWSGWGKNFLDYPLGYGDQKFDVWSINFGYELQVQFGNNLSNLTTSTFTSLLDQYVVANPIPSLR